VLEVLRPGDTRVVARIDRLARRVRSAEYRPALKERGARREGVARPVPACSRRPSRRTTFPPHDPAVKIFKPQKVVWAAIPLCRFGRSPNDNITEETYGRHTRRAVCAHPATGVS